MSRLQNYFSPEFIASGLDKEFFDFVSKLTQAKSKTEEASHVNQELALLKNKMGSPNVTSSRMKDYLVRLMHCFILGYNVDFSVIYAIMATQSGETAIDRRVGYLACTLFLEQDHEMGIMLINTLQRDLKSQNDLDICAALNAVCYLEHQEMVDNVLEFVLQSMDFNKQVVRKKTVMALYCLYERTDMDFKRIEPALRKALHDKDSSVVFAALSVWKMILLEHASQFEDLLPVFHSIHRQIIEKRIHKSFMYHGVLAPWAQLDCLQIYDIYHELNIGSPQDYYKIVVDCLGSMEKKVDAAFAIILECVRLLSTIDPILLGSMSESDDNPFEILNWYLNCANHNLKYLGLLGMSFVDESFWKKEWLDGSLLGKAIQTSVDDSTIITKAIENLDSIVDQEVLKTVCPDMIDALSKNYDQKPTNTMIAYWLINRIQEYHTTIDPWYVATMLSILAETRKNLEESYIQARCDHLKEILLDETNEFILRESAVNMLYKLLSTNSMYKLSPIMVQFAFGTLGEYGYLSTQHTETDIMKQIQKYIQHAEDDYLQIYGLQAIKECISRSKIWLSGLEPILKAYVKSPIPEKQQISQGLLAMLKDRRFEKELEQDDISISKLSINPNRPSDIGRFRETATNSPAVLEIHSTASSSNNSHYEESHDKLDTKQFGKFWVSYAFEEKRVFECSVHEIKKLSKRLSRSWSVEIIELIGQEFIAVEAEGRNKVLVHVQLLPKSRFELTLKSYRQEEIKRFLSTRHLA